MCMGGWRWMKLQGHSGHGVGNEMKEKESRKRLVQGAIFKVPVFPGAVNCLWNFSLWLH